MKLKDLEKRLKNEPNNLGLRVQVAGLMREAGRSLEAVELYRSVALAYRDQGRTQQAIAVCRSILEIAPEDAACQGLLSMLQQGSAVPKRPSSLDMLRRQSQPELKPHHPARPASPTGPRAASPATSPPASRAPSPPGVSMRPSPVPVAPEVPSLRAPTAPVARAATNAPARQATMPAVGRSITKDKPLPRPQVIDRDSPMPVPVRAHRSTEPPLRPARATEPPLRASELPLSARPSDAPTARRSSLDQTPLPPPLPYHLADRTSSLSRISSGDIDTGDETRIDDRPLGLVHAIQHTAHGGTNQLDMGAELDTLQRPRIPSDELRKITEPPPTGPVDVVDPLDDLETPPPREPGEPVTGRRPIARASDDALTPPRTSAALQRPSVPGPRSISSPNLPRVGPRTPSRPPVVSIPPKTSSRPPVVAIPPKHDSYPPELSSLPRDSDDEMTMPRDRLPDKDED